MNRKTIWAIVALVGSYIAMQLIADVAATRFIEIAGVVMPAGTFTFALTFTLRDMLHKRLGKEWARAAIVMAAVLNLVLSGYVWWVTTLDAPVWFALAEPWNQVFALVPSITIGSILAELVSELVDTEVYQWIRTKLDLRHQWAHVLVSNAVSIPIDSLVFSTLAFAVLPLIFGGDVMPFGDVLLRVASGQVLYKFIVAIVSIPGIYLVKEDPLIYVTDK